MFDFTKLFRIPLKKFILFLFSIEKNVISTPKIL